MKNQKKNDHSVRREFYGTCPRDCPDGCSWIVTVEDGVATKLRGNPDHPFTKGRLCSKMKSYLEYAQHPARLLYPMKRTGPKGAGLFKRISWDEAVHEIAAHLQSAIANYGAESVWPYQGTGNIGWIQGINSAGHRLFNALGASRHSATICSVSGHVGMSYTTGSAAGMDNEHLVHSKCIILWGTNTLVTNQHLWTFVQKGHENGAKLVVIDPVRTKTADKADLFLQIKPGTDGALALGIMQQLVQKKRHDLAYLEAKTLGFQGFKNEILSKWNLNTTAAACGLEQGEISRLADLITDSRPTGIHLGMGMQRHAFGGQACRVISCLPAVTGDFNRLGGGICYSTGETYQLNKRALCGDFLRKKPARSLVMTRLGHALLEENNPPVKALIVTAANPVVSNPDQNRVIKGLSREDLFTAVIDCFQTDTADYADILLPSTMQMEQTELGDSYSHLYLHFNEKAVTPPGECQPHTEIFRRIAKKMNLPQPELYASDEELIRNALNSDHFSMKAINLNKLRKKGWMRPGWPEPFQPFINQFQTKSGKFEFASEQAERNGHGIYPFYRSSSTASDPEDGSLVLLSPAGKMRTNSMFSNSHDHSKAGVPAFLLHPDDADQRSLKNRTLVSVWNERGSFRAQLQISDRVKPGTAVSHKGHWAKLFGGSSVNAVVEERDSDMGQGAVYHDTRVFVSDLVSSKEPYQL
ncbi:MAG: molybdopterin oxidoreductase [Acidobacteria bacterium]|nr:MAG: molybdopterin oxidoreductase [Acidobacteriota bacterium]